MRATKFLFAFVPGVSLLLSMPGQAQDSLINNRVSVLKKKMENPEKRVAKLEHDHLLRPGWTRMRLPSRTRSWWRCWTNPWKKQTGFQVIH